MLFFTPRRANQLWMARKIYRQRSCFSSLGRDEQQLCIFTVELWNGENRQKVLPSYSHADENACSLNGRQDDE